LGETYRALVICLLLIAAMAAAYTIGKFGPEFPTPALLDGQMVVHQPPLAVGSGVSRFLWNDRTIDMITQAFLLFATAVACIALLRPFRRR